jgi:hypothetical protein
LSCAVPVLSDAVLAVAEVEGDDIRAVGGMNDVVAGAAGEELAAIAAA